MSKRSTFSKRERRKIPSNQAALNEVRFFLNENARITELARRTQSENEKLREYIRELELENIRLSSANTDLICELGIEVEE